MKKIIAVILCLIAMLSLASCELGDQLDGISSSIVEAGAEILGDYLREDDSWSTAEGE